MFRKIFLVILTMAAVFTGSVYAVGLGEIESKSALNQSLQAEITLLSAGELAEHEIKAAMASQAEFEKLGIDKPFFLNKIKFTTYRKDNGQLAIKLTSRDAIKEPFLNFVVELNWPNGRLLREYTILLDPPVYQDSGGATQNQASSASTGSSPSRSSRTAEPSAPPVRFSQSTSVEPSISGTTYGPVKEADTLWRIATRARPDSSVSIHQTLVAIYRANPDAFANGNINNLMKGKVLQIPNLETIRSVPHRAALQDVVMQNRQWHSGGGRRVVDQTGAGTASGGKADTGGRLSLSAANDSDNASGFGSDTGNADLADIKSKLTQTEEEAATLQAENEELRTRLADALKKLEDMQSGGAVNVQDTELAALANQDALNTDDQTTDAEQNEGAESIASSDELGAESSQSATEQAMTGDEGQTEPSAEDENLAEAGQEATSSQSSEAADSAAAADQAGQQNTPPANSDPLSTYPEPAKEKGLFDSIMDNSLMLGGGLAVIALIVIGVFWQMRKRMEEEEFQDDLVASAGAGSMDTTETFELPEVGDDMLVELDMDEEKSGDSASDEEFDPLGEADIYIAYGKFEEAENLLLDAIEENPVRSDFKVKLMECYAEQDNREKFEALAGEVAEAVDAEEWMPQVAELRSQHWEGGASEAEDEFDLPSTEDIFGDDSSDSSLDDLTLEDESEQSGLSDDAFNDDNMAYDSSLDADIIDADAGDEALTLDDEDDSVFDSLDDDVLESEESSIGESTEETSAEEDFSLDDESFDSLDDDIDFESNDDISLDMDDDFGFDEEGDEDLSGPVTEEGDEVSTKLDLARAYIDMGDADGAREILNEVVAEGNDAQKSEAQELLDKMD